MGLFGSKESKEDKKAAKIQKYMDIYGLSDLTDLEKEVIGNIVGMDAANTLMDIGSALSGSVTDGERILSSKLDMMIAQNWMIIRRLESLNKK